MAWSLKVIAVTLIASGVVLHQGLAQSPTPVDLNNGSTGSLIFVGTATNTTDPRQPITAPVRIGFDKNANGILTVSPPLTGSGICTIGQYSLDSGHIDIACKGAVNITWRGTISGAKATGTYTVEPGHQSGHFEWSITVPTKEGLSARSDGDTAPTPALNDVYSVGNGVTGPTVLFKIDPEYSEEARKAKYSGSVLLSVIVDTEGRARDIRIVKHLGMGLDEKAVDAVEKWTFKPGMRNDQPVNVAATVEVNFKYSRNDAQMVRNDAIANDPALEKLCFDLVKNGHPARGWLSARGPLAIIGGPAPFEIDSTYVKNARSAAEDVTFIAVLTKPPEIGGSSLVQCANQNRRGFDVMNYTVGEYPYWRLLTKQKPTIEDNGITAQTKIAAASDPKKLIAERDFETEQLQFHEKMLATSSFAERTKLFCRDAADAALANNLHGFDHTAYSGTDLARSMAEGRESQARRSILESIPHGPYGLTINDLNSALARLRDEPSTREGEVVRQQKVSAIRYALADYDREFDACRRAITFGEAGVTFPLPTSAELRGKTAHERERIAEINRELALNR